MTKKIKYSLTDEEALEVKLLVQQISFITYQLPRELKAKEQWDIAIQLYKLALKMKDEEDDNSSTN